MYDQIRGDTLYIILYTAVTILSLNASCYLLFRQGNAFAKDITKPARLRRWTAASFAAVALNHLWYMPIMFLSSSEDIMMIDLIGGLLDSMTVFPLMIVVLFTMLQDRKRPLWLIVVMFAPLVVGNAFGVATLSYDFLPIVYIYALVMCLGLIIYMVRALRQYGRWLRDNYADLEHKEVWRSFVVLAIILLMFAIYAFTSEGTFYQYGMQVIVLLLISFLLWRVETLSDLSIPIQSDTAIAVDDLAEEMVTTENVEDTALLSMRNNIGPLLKQHCEEPQLYLQHDLTLLQLAKAVGTNRFYLSQYFTSQDTSYNAYINNLRVNHFINLYHEAVATNRSFTAQKLAQESGFRNYNTFNSAFKRKMGMSVTAWMKPKSAKIVPKSAKNTV